MMPRSKFLAIGAVILAFWTSVYAESPKRGENEVIIREHRQKVYFYSAEGAGQHRRVLFAPGDGGCRGFAITITEGLAKAGYDAFEPWTSEIDAYLKGGGTLKELRKRITDAGLQVPDVIGFAEFTMIL